MVVRFKTAPTVSTEGFFGDILGKIKSAFKGKQKFPTDKESFNDKELEELKKLLNETVLNDTWLKDVTFLDGEISSVGILPQLSYDGTFDESDPVGFLTKAIEKVNSVWSKYLSAVIKYDADIQKIHADLERKTAKYTEEDDEVVEKLIQAAIAAVEKLSFPGTVLPAKFPILGSEYLVYDRAAMRVNEIRDSKKYGPIPRLTSVQVKPIANLIVKLIDLYIDGVDKLPGWIDHSDGSHFWEIATYMDHIDDYSGLVYYQSVEDRLELYSVYWSYNLAISSLVKWLNVSIKQ